MTALCLTIDLDWAHDEVIADTLAVVADHGVRATWFITHATPMVAEIVAVRGQELGLHPNFNPHLEAGSVESAAQTLARLQNIVPGATSLRSHSLARSSKLASMFRALGVTHESNCLLPPAVGSDIKPWRDFSGLIQVPIRWEDDVRLVEFSLGDPTDHLSRLDPFVVDFHPIHVFLNTTSIEEYESARPHMRDPKTLRERRRPPDSDGSRDRFLTLLAAARNAKMTSVCVKDLQPSIGA